MMNTNNVYIVSIEGADIYNHMIKDTELNKKYTGMLPFSLELLKLRELGLKVKTTKHNSKEISDDIINVKFNQKVKSREFLIKKLNRKILGLQAEEDKKYNNYINKLNEFIKQIELEEDTNKWQEVSQDKLREYLYTNGFTIKTSKKKSIKYVVYKRSTSKSRTGQVLFIKESLYQEMINWSRMRLPLVDNMDLDYAGLLAYESLVGSALEDTIVIKPENIFMVSDINSVFTRTCNVVKRDENGFLDSYTEDVEVKNSLFDGESLLESEFFVEGQSMKLLRNHMFKSAAFNCNMQKFFKDNCPEDINYDDWQLSDKYNNKIFAKDVKLITTPSSLKALKFSSIIGSEAGMFDYWKKVVEEDGCIFGVCKHEKQSKRGLDENGFPLQQSSYQMINCLPMDNKTINHIAKVELEYIAKLKNDDDFFIEHILKNSNSINSNQMFADLYKVKKDIINTKIFRDFRKAEINSYVTYVKKGKVRLTGDYCVMAGNIMELLYHAIGVNVLSKDYCLQLKDNEICTTLFQDGEELIGFRNPNTSPANVLIAKNKYVDDIHKYFNFSQNIVAVNAVQFPLQDILSSCDYDSDTVLLFNNKRLVDIGKKCFGHYNVTINKIHNEPRPYKLNKHDMYEVDRQLATSQKNIGRVVNIAQLCLSTYWDQISKNAKPEELSNLMKKVDIMTVLSCVCIDLAKKFYDINIEEQVKNILENTNLNKMKPLFWQHVSQNDNVKNKVIKYNCPMDFLHETMSGLKYAEDRKNINFSSLLVKYNIKDGDRKQENKIVEKVAEMCNKINGINAKYSGNTDDEVKERNELIDDEIKYCNFSIQRLTVRPETMYSILLHIVKNRSKTITKLLNVLYSTQQEVFLNAFIKG